MAALSINEILSQLKKLGIVHTSELGTYLSEYEMYYHRKRPRFTEKRSYERIPVGEEVRICCDDRFFTGTVLNVSESGMFIGTKKFFPQNSLVCIENDILKVIARVKRSTEMIGYYDGIGVELAKSDENYLQFVNRLKPPDDK